ncbi:MAG: GNAT family N-acetyltransferase [Candidatus Carbobacillus altaicus]|nr:GNAT family N-acetyltransferase [Candidatus Carbobacillus altaicus]
MQTLDESIILLDTPADWQQAYPLIAQLRHHLSEESYMEHMQAMTAQGYHLFGLMVKKELVSLAGGLILHNFYNGRYFMLYDLVTSATHRSAGYGERLLSFVERWAEAHGCQRIELTSGLERSEAHRFYEEKMGYLRTSYVFRRTF